MQVKLDPETADMAIVDKETSLNDNGRTDGEKTQSSVLDRKELNSDERSNKILTIPNIISFFRILLIPFIIWTYVFLDLYVVALILFAVSALSDVADGIIARKFRMTSEFGKLIDPVADKFTQGAMMICLTVRFPYIIILIIAFVLREIGMIVFGTILKKKTSRFSSAKWYGKANTVIVEGSVLFLLVFGPFIPSPAVDVTAVVLISLAVVSVFVSFVLYTFYYVKLFREIENEKNA